MLKQISIGLVVVIVPIVIIQFIMKLNYSGVGKYQAIGNNKIINTTTGTVYRAEAVSDDEFIWVKMVYFDKK